MPGGGNNDREERYSAIHAARGQEVSAVVLLDVPSCVMFANLPLGHCMLYYKEIIKTLTKED